MHTTTMQYNQIESLYVYAHNTHGMGVIQYYHRFSDMILCTHESVNLYIVQNANMYIAL